MINKKNESKNKNAQETELVIPDLRTAKEQFAYATRYEQIIMGFVNPDKKKKKVQMDKVRQVHEAVIRNFPNDQEYTPLSKLTLADCQGHLGNYDKAIEMWQQTISEYPNNELIQCRGMFSIARAYELDGQFVKSKAIDKEIVDRFGGSTNPRIRQYASNAQTSYLRTREEPVKPKRKFLGSIFK